ncbi:sigma 54-interacting transcriptional regulator [Sorangium sp. So ce1000]|uniref:sigma 54-interacting transcriptional regulator n=1 Tax=Sorangium sp. So ce1000 TaxID=3133325 RepID=UPI003F5DFE3D
MAASASTLDLGSSQTAAPERSQGDTTALMIAWAASEPHRIGELAFFESEGGAQILGRGGPRDGSGVERTVFVRQRPGCVERTADLTGPGLSREQLRIRPEGSRLRIERIGKCAMEVRGERVDRCVVEPGDTLLLKGQLLLFCTRRPRKLAPLTSAKLADAPVFGAPDSHGIVGECPAVWRLRDRIAWMATADEHTLLLGGSGSGKELAARAVHALSARARGPFIARNAATIPASLIDAELFGNVKGYPNPGMPERPGLIGAANGGTLFLDEIGELPEGLQANLLRVLDEGGEYHCLGAAAAKRSHFRLIGATNRDPAALKHDVGARLVLRLEVPGLDERRDDIPFLARHLLRRAAAKSPDAVRRFLAARGDGDPEPAVGATLIDHLMRRRYATNLRELDALLWRAMSTSQGSEIEWSEGSPPVAAPPPAAIDEPDSPAGASEPPPDVPDPSAERVRASLEEHRGNVTRAAQSLGLSSRYVLYRLMRKYGLSAE